jgi:hypothetical protein
MEYGRTQYQFPETVDRNGRVAGRDVPIEQSDLSTLRKQQLVHLARAYDVAIPVDAPKTMILPLMQTAQMMGQLQGKPKRPYYYQRAHYTTDYPMPEDAPAWTNTEAVYGAPQAPKRGIDVAAHSDFRSLQKACKDAGIKCFGMTEEDMRDALARISDLKERENAAPDAD